MLCVLRRLLARHSPALTLALLAAQAPARALDIKIWPLLDYHSDAAGTRTLHLLGPLFSYESGAQQSELTVRPLFTLTRGPRPGQSRFALLYPLWVSRWDADETDHRVLGLISYRTQTVRRPDEWDRRFTVFPGVFYRHSPTRGTWLSVLPFYADMPDVFGYERIQMVAFPLYLRLQEPLRVRTWAPFPFVGWSGGTLGRGYRLWPVYGWDQNGEVDRMRYVLWPFYITQDRHFTRPESEHRLLVFPFYARLDSPAKENRSYAGPFFTHTIDREAHTDTWGFPWPFWVSQRDLTTGRRTALRLAPFYEDTHLGGVHKQFVMWPVYRWETQEAEAYRYRRSDVLFVVYRNIAEVQSDPDHRRHLRTLFPLYRADEQDGENELSTLAVLDALFPRNETIRRLYAPLWQLYTRQADGTRAARWSLLWDLISSDGERIRYPIGLDRSQ
jgi:hypothetical protein